MSNKALYPKQGFFFLLSSAVIFSSFVNENNNFIFPLIFVFSFTLFVRERKDLIYLVLAFLPPIFFGMELLLITYPALLVSRGFGGYALKILIGAILLNKISLYISNLSIYQIYGWNLATLLYLFLPTLMAFIFVNKKNYKLFGIFYFGVLLVIFSIIFFNSWITIELFTSPLFRLCALLITTLIFINTPIKLEIKKNDTELINNKKNIFLLIIIFSIPILFISEGKYKKIIFDESHGQWASIRDLEKHKNKFGRDYFYSYSILNEFLEKNGYLTNSLLNENELNLKANELFILKMPSAELSEKFIDNLLMNINDGGDVLVISDHTNLYNNSYYLNKFLKNLSIEIGDTAVFNKQGMPNKSETTYFSFIHGMISSNIEVMSWLTGTSLKAFGINFFPLDSYRLSFSEEGDYSNQNRFGTFQPNTKKPYLEHISFGKVNYGKGSVYILLDSTPWSNFSISKVEYKQYFQNLIHICEQERLTYLQQLLLLALLIYLITKIVLKIDQNNLLGISLIVLYFSVITLGRFIVLKELKEDEDYNLQIYSGDEVNYEYLNQLVPTGEKNYTRITSALNRNNLDPLVLNNNKKINLNSSRKILAININPNDLPQSYEVINYIRGGGNLTLLFDQNKASNKDIKNFLNELGIRIKPKVSLGFVESIDSIQDNLISRKTNKPIKDIRWISYATDNSFFKLDFMTNIFQRFKIRPIGIPYKNGFLNISFSADQFSDYVIGDIWEGIHTTNIAKQREKLLANLVTNQLNIKYDMRSSQERNIYYEFAKLNKYQIYEDGQLLIQGKFHIDNYSENVSPSRDIEAYLYNLGSQAKWFINNQCLHQDNNSCSNNFISDDLVEWRVIFKINNTTNKKQVELIHDRQTAGLNFTYNVLFSE